HLVSLHHFQFWGVTNPATSSVCGIWCPCTISSSGGLPTAQQVLCVAFGVPAPFPVPGGYQPRNKFCVWHLVSLHHFQFRGATNRATSSACGIWCPCTISSSGAITNCVTSSVPAIWCPCTISSSGGLPTTQQVLRVAFGVPAPFPVPGGYQPVNKFCAWHLVSLHPLQFRGDYQLRNKFCPCHLVSLHHFQLRGA